MKNLKEPSKDFIALLDIVKDLPEEELYSLSLRQLLTTNLDLTYQASAQASLIMCCLYYRNQIEQLNNAKQEQCINE